LIIFEASFAAALDRTDDRMLRAGQVFVVGAAGVWRILFIITRAILAKLLLYL